MFHQQACALGCCLQRSHLLVVVVGFLAGSLVLHQCLVHFHACVQQGLFETKAGFLLLGFRYFQLGDVRSFIKQSCVREATAEARNLPGLTIMLPALLVHPALPLNVMAG